MGKSFLLYHAPEDIGTIPGIISKIIEINENAIVLEVELPDDLYLLPPPTGQPLYCTIAGDNCVYKFESKFICNSTLASKLWSIELPQNLVSYQHRDFIRVQAYSLTLRVKYPKDFGNYSNLVEVPLRDVSGAGLGFVSDHQLELDKQILIEIDGLPGFKTPLKGAGIVRRCQEVSSVTDNVSYNIGLFIEPYLSPVEQDKLIKAVHELQRNYIKMGLGVK